MQFTRAEAYGIFGVLYLADQPPGRITPLSEISESQDVPEKFLAKIFQSLSKSGLVRSYRGVNGGFALGRPANQINIREILESIQGPYLIAKCLNTGGICEKRGCSIKLLLTKAQDAMIDIFNSHTLADLLRWEKESEMAGSV